MTNELIFFSNNYNLPFCKNLFHQHSLNKMKLNIEILLNHKSYYNIQYNTRWQILLIIKIILLREIKILCKICEIFFLKELHRRYQTFINF